jgi:hypothetical protein
LLLDSPDVVPAREAVRKLPDAAKEGLQIADVPTASFGGVTISDEVVCALLIEPTL